MLLSFSLVWRDGKCRLSYQKLAAQEENVLFGGRLGQYKYYDMDKVIEAALEMVAEEMQER